MANITIDGTPVQAKDGATVLKAAEAAGIAIPHFCYHPAFVPEGSCRLCLVEIEGSQKLELSCATPVRDGMKVATQTPAVREARRSVLEFFLAEHPLDCPICDKSGECQLQDYYQDYGLTDSVFREAKDKHEKKTRIGDKLLLDRERCVLCTRCVRFLDRVTKTHELGVFGRGARAEISTYEDEPVRNSYSGNLVDLCPVGAITDLDFRFKSRAWLLVKGESICPHCSRGCNIYIDYQPGFPRVPDSAKVLRIRPRVNDAVNGPWICDFGRYGFVRAQSQDRWHRVVWNRGDGPVDLSWDQSLGLVGEKIASLRLAKATARISLVLNTSLTNEELFLAKKIFIEGLNAGRVRFADPPFGPGDDFLLRPERTANRRGALELGFSLGPVDWGPLAEQTDILIVFGQPPDAGSSPGQVESDFKNIATKVFVTAHDGALVRQADFVLPSATVAENTGSFTNEAGRVQAFSAVARLCGETRTGVAILADLAIHAGLDVGVFGPLRETARVSREMAQAVPFFGKNA